MAGYYSDDFQPVEDDDSSAGLVRLLERTHYEGMAILTELDPQAVVYPESGWRVQDIVSHLTAWEEAVARALAAYQTGSEQPIPNFPGLEAFNAAQFEARRSLYYTEVYAHWDTARTGIKAIVADLTAEQLAGTMRYPSGRQGGCAVLIHEVCDHQGRHFADIVAAVEGE